MGGCSCKESNSNKHDYISQALLDQEKIKQHKKIIILGTAGSGKTTLFNSLQTTYHGEVPSGYTPATRSNLVEGIIQLISLSNISHKINKYDDCYIDIHNHIDKILQMPRTSYDLKSVVDNLDANERQNLADSLQYIWELDAIQSAYKYRHRSTKQYYHIEN
eukprot:120112_1